MIYHTFDEWKDQGWIVMKGEKSHKQNSEGIAIFSKDQVEQKDDILDGVDMWDVCHGD
jgi:hypothetical protein